MTWLNKVGSRVEDLRDKASKTACASRYIGLVGEAQGVFGEIPLGRPPYCGFEHTIELEDGVNAIITTPYGHPNTYKDEIERVI